MTLLAVDIPIVDDLIGGVVEDAATAVLDSVVGFLFGLVGGAIEAMTTALIGAMEATSSLSLTSAEFEGLSGIRSQVLGISMVLLVGFLFMNVMKSVAAGEPGNVMRAALVDLPSAMLWTALFTSVVDKVIEVVDLASAAVIGDVGESIGQVGSVLAAGVAIPTPGVVGAGLLGVIFGLLYVFAALLVWAELLVRSALVYIIIVIAPLGYAARASAGARQIARRITEVTAGVILAKFGIALAFGIGASLIDSGNTIGDETGGVVPDFDLSAMFIGTTVIMLAAFMPWMILKLIPVLETATAMGGAERSPLKAAGTAAGIGIAAITAGRLSGTGAGSGAGTLSSGGSSGLAGSSGAGGSGGSPGSSGGGPSSSPSGGGSSATSASASSSRRTGQSTGGDTLVGSDDRGSASSVEVVDVGTPRPGIITVSPPVNPTQPGPTPLGSSTRTNGTNR